ncbi:MAG: hypothetical protein EA350_16185 [Gemmatimonadales bacterium]|nr:MAG: hypothetical protein EA350_16185 [Gemmatimonadales bacterium]
MKHRTGRGWRGVRRSLTDLTNDLTSDVRVLDHEGCWASASTRGRIYQEAESREVMALAAALRSQLRSRLLAVANGELVSGNLASGALQQRAEKLLAQKSMDPEVTEVIRDLLAGAPREETGG